MVLGWIAIAILGAAGLVGFYQGHRLNRDGVRVSGVVADVAMAKFDQRASPVAVLEFRTVDGRVVRAKSRFGGISPEPGTPVSVLYDPKKPENVVIDTFVGRGNWIPLIAVGFAVVISVVVILDP